MDRETLRVYLDRRVAAAMAYVKVVRNVAPVEVVDAAYAAYDEAHALWQLAPRRTPAAQSAEGEPNGH